MSILLGQIEFEYPAMLFGLAALPVIAYFAYRTGVASGRSRRIASVACRMMIVTLLVVAFAGIAWRGQNDRRWVAFITDTSRSVGGEAEQTERFIAEARKHQGNHQAVFIPFAGQASQPSAEPTVAPDGLEPLASDPASAVTTGLAAAPSGLVPGIVLQSDGIETRGDLERAALGSDIPISVVPLEAFPFDEACVAELSVPPQACRFASTPVEVVIHANAQIPGALVELDVEGRPIAKRQVDLSPGIRRIRFELPPGIADDRMVRARLTAAKDTISENNMRRARIFAPPPVRILLVHDPAQPPPLGAALKRQGFDVMMRRPEQLPESGEPWAAYDVVILSEVAARDLSADRLAALERYVHDGGGGLIAMGGTKTFGEAAYRDTPLERILPVEPARIAEAKKAILAMVLVIDCSGSMEEERRMELAKLAAKQSIALLEPHDKAGVIAFSDDATWIAPLAPCSDKRDLVRRIDTLRPEGETNMYSAVERAFLALEQTVADRRHMILLTDGIPAPGDYAEIAVAMARAGVTLSTVSISRGAEQDLLQKMARLAGGRHRHCDDPADVPKILVQETRAATSEAGLRDFVPFVLKSLPGLRIADAPKLGAYAPTSPKPGAETLLMAGPDPLLTWWCYGKGVAVALTSDASRWRTWPGYAAFWRRLIRQAVRRPAPQQLHLTIHRAADKATVTVELAAPELWSTDPADVAVQRVMPQTESLAVQQVGPGRYQAEFSAAAAGEYQVQASVAVGSDEPLVARCSLFVDYPDELALRGTDEALLRSVATATGGAFDPEPAAVFAPDGRTVEYRKPLWSYFVFVATLLFVADVALRRLRF